MPMLVIPGSGERHNTISSLLVGGSTLVSKIKSKIWKARYVELGTLATCSAPSVYVAAAALQWSVLCLCDMIVHLTGSIELGHNYQSTTTDESRVYSDYTIRSIHGNYSPL